GLARLRRYAGALSSRFGGGLSFASEGASTAPSEASPQDFFRRGPRRPPPTPPPRIAPAKPALEVVNPIGRVQCRHRGVPVCDLRRLHRSAAGGKSARGVHGRAARARASAAADRARDEFLG